VKLIKTLQIKKLKIMKKLKKFTIEALRREMPVLEEMEERSIIGGYDANDCWWRCIAYGSYCSTKLLVFDPNMVDGWEGVSEITHTVIVEGYSTSGDKVYVYCPQTGLRTFIDTAVLNPNPTTGTSGAGKFYINVN
jgi:natural product precursor